MQINSKCNQIAGHNSP